MKLSFILAFCLRGWSQQAADPDLPIVKTSVTVTAVRGQTEAVEQSAQVVSTVDREQMRERPLPTLGHIFEGMPNILVQQTGPGQISPFLRGLTGYQVLNLIDGIRFNNSTFRSGPNQYLAFVDPSQSSRVESVLGPTGALYGSDAMGGVIQVLTPDTLHSDSRELHGYLTLFGATADRSAGSAAQIQLSNRHLAWLVGGAARRHGDLRAGSGTDSRHAIRRFLGLDPRAVTGERLPDTGYEQYGVHTKFAARIRSDHLLTLWYQHSRLQNVQNYKDLWGGLGRLQSRLDPQELHFAYARYEKLKVGWLDSASATFSVNQQLDGTVRQGLRITDAVIRDHNQVRSFGYTGQGTGRLPGKHLLVFGADVYDERVASSRLSGSSLQRPLYPDGSRYDTFGSFVQDRIELIPNRLRATLAARFTRASYLELGFNNITWQAALSYQATRVVGIHILAGRGFRAPNLNDLGGLGLNDLGFEIPAADAAGATLGLGAAENSLSAGKRVAPLKPETLDNYEAGMTMRTNRFYSRLQGFVATLDDPIVRRTLLFPLNQIPTTLAGQQVFRNEPTTAQLAEGFTTVRTSLDPRAIKAFVNDGRSRYAGVEMMGRYYFTRNLRTEAAYSFIAGQDLYPNRPVRRLPPQQGMASVRYDLLRFWLEARSLAAGPQRRLSGGDLDDERIGASRSRNDIADFYNSARLAGYAIAETLGQIQNRVLPGVAPGTRVPLYRSTAGWMSVEIRGGVPLGERIHLNGGLGNVFDKNYRVHGSGLDSPGRQVWANLQYTF